MSLISVKTDRDFLFIPLPDLACKTIFMGNKILKLMDSM